MDSYRSSSDYVDVVQKQHILSITLARPERKNALNREMYQALADLLNAANEDDAIRAVHLQGSGDCFCSGNDLQEFADHAAAGTVESMAAENAPLSNFMRQLLYCNKPVVAAIAGPAVGIGATMLLHCDLVYAAESASLRFPFAHLGLCPEFASSWLLPERIGHQRCAQALFLAEIISARQAHEWGLVNAVVADADLPQQVATVLRRLTQMPAAALRSTKYLLRQGVCESASAVMQNERRFFVRGLQSQEFADALAAFQNRNRDH